MRSLPHQPLIKTGDRRPSAPFSSTAEPINGKAVPNSVTYAEVARAAAAPAQPTHNQDIGAAPAQP